MVSFWLLLPESLGVYNLELCDCLQLAIQCSNSEAFTSGTTLPSPKIVQPVKPGGMAGAPLLLEASLLQLGG